MARHFHTCPDQTSPSGNTHCEGNRVALERKKVRLNRVTQLARFTQPPRCLLVSNNNKRTSTVHALSSQTTYTNALRSRSSTSCRSSQTPHLPAERTRSLSAPQARSSDFGEREPASDRRQYVYLWSPNFHKSKQRPVGAMVARSPPKAEAVGSSPTSVAFFFAFLLRSAGGC